MTIMPTGTIRSQYQFGSSTVRFQEIHNIQDQKVHNANEKQVSQQSAKRLNSASKSRRRLLSRESRSPDLVKPEVSDLQANSISIRLEEEAGNEEEDDDGDVTPKVCQLDSVREVEECWSSISWSSLYDRGTDSSLSWADDEYEKETTEIVQSLFHQFEDLFYAPKSQRKKKSQAVSLQEKECFLWREHFTQLRLVGSQVKLEKSRVRENRTLSITGRQSNVLRRNGRARERDRAPVSSEDGGAEDREEVFAQHGDYREEEGEQKKIIISQKFETEPSVYFQEKLCSALFDCLLTEVAGELQPAVESYENKLSGQAGQLWEGLRPSQVGVRRDSLEEDSIFSLGKIIASPRYGQYPDLSDEEDPLQPPLSLPTLRQVPLSAPAARIQTRPAPAASSQPSLTRTKRSNSFKTENHSGLSRNNSERRKSEIKKQNRSLERNYKPGSSSSIRSTNKYRSRSQSGSPPYGGPPVSLPPIERERPKTMGSQISARGWRTPGRGSELEQKSRNVKQQVQFSVSGTALKQHEDRERKNGINNRISMNGPLHWDLGGVKSYSRKVRTEPVTIKDIRNVLKR